MLPHKTQPYLSDPDFRAKANPKHEAKGTRNDNPYGVCGPLPSRCRLLRLVSSYLRLHTLPFVACILFSIFFEAVMSNRGQVYNYSAILRQRVEGLAALFGELQTLRRRLRREQMSRQLRTPRISKP